MNFLESAIKSTKLSREAFATALRHGRGCVVMHVHEHGMGGVEDLLLAACLENQAYDRQCEGSRAAWMYSLFKGTHAYPRFAGPILAALARSSDDNDGDQLRELASLMGRDGDMQAAAALRDFVWAIRDFPATFARKSSSSNSISRQATKPCSWPRWSASRGMTMKCMLSEAALSTSATASERQRWPGSHSGSTAPTPAPFAVAAPSSGCRNGDACPRTSQTKRATTHRKGCAHSYEGSPDFPGDTRRAPAQTALRHEHRPIRRFANTSDAITIAAPGLVRHLPSGSQ